MGNELDLKKGLMKHDDNEHWWQEEEVKGHVGNVPAV